MQLVKTTKNMRRVQGPAYDRYNDLICTHEGGVWDFERTEWRWHGILVWYKDGPYTEVPWYQFVNDCLGTG